MWYDKTQSTLKKKRRRRGEEEEEGEKKKKREAERRCDIYFHSATTVGCSSWVYSKFYPGCPTTSMCYLKGIFRPSAQLFVLFCFVLFCFVLFCFVLLCYVSVSECWYRSRDDTGTNSQQMLHDRQQRYQLLWLCMYHQLDNESFFHYHQLFYVHPHVSPSCYLPPPSPLCLSLLPHPLLPPSPSSLFLSLPLPPSSLSSLSSLLKFLCKEFICFFSCNKSQSTHYVIITNSSSSELQLDINLNAQSKLTVESINGTFSVIAEVHVICDVAMTSPLVVFHHSRVSGLFGVHTSSK